MLEIRNLTRSPVPLIVRSRREVPGSGSKSFTTLIISGIGKGKHIYYLDEERTTTYVERAVKDKLIKTRIVPDSEIKANIKGE